ncbi:LuxR C-terminal-related transcriptional regulator [Salinispirillum sp. LH 10-3-1]|uniref:LuxR C-terminal-related transcriptional regulator n=1 Tax=Salinispirillum sp. LH 10-3-1 TaxID=2952525 RepID=A0AB38YBU6_9GAMM
MLYDGVMPTPLLATKLYAPPVRSTVIRRPRLLTRIDAGREGKLTLISAPAGFGKTTLVSSWLADQGATAAWLSLDDNDKDPYRLLTYLIAAIQSVQSQFGLRLMAALQSAQPPALDTITTELINELHALENTITLVLDDLHSAQSDATNPLFTALMDYLPDTVRVIITTREEPSLALAKLRAKGDLTEFRVSDLRFNTDEITQFLNQIMHLNIPTLGIMALEKSTEGWITGLQLAALSLKDQMGLDDLLAQIEQGHQFILDYLLEDVLLKQPEHIQHFLLHTAVLKRFCAPLCDVVVKDAATQRNSDAPAVASQEALEQIERANLFIIPLDAERKWFRYHHLFAELLRKRLYQQSPEIARQRHVAASHWFRQEGLEIEAFEHAAAAEDYELALRIIGSGIMPLQFRGGVFPIMSWLATLPPDVLNQYPELWVNWASSLLVIGRVDGVADKADAAERALQHLPPDTYDPEILGRIASIRATLAVTRHDHEGILTQAEIALSNLKPSNLSVRASITWATGYAHSLRREPALAEKAYADSLVVCDDIGHTTIGNMCRLGLAKIWLDNLHLYQVAKICQEAIDRAGDTPPAPICDAYLALAMAHYQWGALEEALQYARLGLPLAQKILHTDRAAYCELFMAQVALAQGDLAKADELLTQIERAIQQNGYDLQRPYLASLRTRLALQQQNLIQAEHWAQQHPQMHYRVIVCLANGEVATALTLLDTDASPCITHHDQLLRHLSRARVSHAQHDTPTALHYLAQAIELAEPHNALRVFLDEGAAMEALLKEAQLQGLVEKKSSAFVNKLLRLFCPPNIAIQPSELPEPISKREREVLQLIADGLSNQEISERLHRALSTIKGHNKSIFEKLNVQRRTEAIAKARELGLL